MTIIGLENNYYLSQNDIWITVNGFTNPISSLELTATNLTTSIALPPLKMASSPTNDFQFNISQVIRALMPKQNHISVNSLQNFQINFTAKFVDTEIADDVTDVFKYFVYGGRNKSGNKEWYLTASEELVIGKWIEWQGITLPGYAKRIQGSSIVDFVPSNPFIKSMVNNCEYKILKFRNSIGGYQYFIFEKFIFKTKSKSGKTIQKITNRLRVDNFQNLQSTDERTIELQTRTPFEIQEVFTELVISDEVYLFNPSGADDDAKWELLKKENNDSIENNYDRVYENKIEYSFSNYIVK